jgi:replicative DNA helicase
MAARTELIILTSLLKDESYLKRTIPFLRSEYFHEKEERIVFDTIVDYVNKYNTNPTVDSLLIEIEERNDIGGNDYDSAVEIVNDISKADSDNDDQWLIDTTEKFCQKQALQNSLMESIEIMAGKSKKDTGAIPSLLTEALSVSFDSHIGHDYIDDSEERFAYYNRKEEHIPFDISLFNDITEGGLIKKTLNVLMASPGAGKTLAMCHMAASAVSEGRNVLYITLEMAEEKISERIDANLMNVSMADLKNLPKQIYDKKIDDLRQKTTGKLIVKEYPTVQAGAGHFRHLVKELSMKKKFVPDILFIDYINLCQSMIYRGANVNSYEKIKSIAEELRGLAVELAVPIVTATQINRSGSASSDVSMEDVAESFGLPATADLFLALIRTDELDEMNQIMVKQLKNRYSDMTAKRRFVIGVDRQKMRLFDCEEDAQGDLIQDTDLSSSKKPRDFSGINFD